MIVVKSVFVNIPILMY